MISILGVILLKMLFPSCFVNNRVWRINKHWSHLTCILPRVFREIINWITVKILRTAVYFCYLTLLCKKILERQLRCHNKLDLVNVVLNFPLTICGEKQVKGHINKPCNKTDAKNML